jgi:CheY-like chemotaxis protein
MANSEHKQILTDQSKAEYILVVEDDMDTRVSLLLLLQDSGFKTIGAGNGLEALKVMVEAYQHRHLPNLILLDINMPLMSGWELMSILKLCQNVISEIPILLTTGENIPPNDHYGVIRKPYSFEQIVERLKKAMSPKD